jgi:outer membrane PBP1 activator LpoA protein
MKKLLFLLTLFTFAGCVAIDSPTTTRPDPITVNLQNETQQKIRSLESQGDYYAAAREYMRLASLSSSPQKEDYQLSAIEAYLKGNLLVEARLELTRVNIQATPLLVTRYELLTARLEVAEGQTEAGLQRLARIVPTAAQQAQYSEVKALAYEKKGEMLTALQERMVLDKQLRSDPIKKLGKL